MKTRSRAIVYNLDMQHSHSTIPVLLVLFFSKGDVTTTRAEKANKRKLVGPMIRLSSSFSQYMRKEIA